MERLMAESIHLEQPVNAFIHVSLFVSIVGIMFKIAWLNTQTEFCISYHVCSGEISQCDQKYCVFRRVYLCCRKVCTMLPLMMLRASHTSMATMFLVRALEKLSLDAATVPPVSAELVLLISRSRGPEEVELSITNISSSQSEGTQKWNLMFYRQIPTISLINSWIV